MNLRRAAPSLIFLFIGLSLSSPVLAATSPTMRTEVGVNLVAPSALSLNVVPDKLGEVKPDETVTYTVLYENKSGLPVNSLSLSVTWGFEIDVVADYVLNSAAEAYGGSMPTVDLINRTISWQIPLLPADLGLQQTSFQLHTRATHPAAGTYSLFVDALIAFGGQTLVTAGRVSNFVVYLEEQPSPGPIKSKGLIITNVRILEVTAHHALITWDSSRPSEGLIRYGLSSAYGLEASPSAGLAAAHSVKLDNLDPETVYHFQVAARSDALEVTSEDYLFKTAQEGIPVPTLDVGSLLFRVYGLRLHPTTKGILTLFSGLKTEVELPVYGEGLLVSLDIDGHKVSVFPQDPPWFTGSFVTPSGLGGYRVNAEARDRAGNYIAVEVATVAVVSRPKVVDFNGKMVAGASVSLYRFNAFIKRFALFDIARFSQENPLTTTESGEMGWVVPYGRYEIRASAPGFQSYRSPEIVMLQNGVLTEGVVLTRIPLSIFGRVWYFLRRLVGSTWTFLGDLGQSLIDAGLVPRLAFPLLILTALAVGVEFFLRTGLGRYSFFRFLIFFPVSKRRKAWGEVRDAAKRTAIPLVYVELYALDMTKIAWTFTNAGGEFGFDQPAGEYLMKFSKRGYEVPPLEAPPHSQATSLARVETVKVVYEEGGGKLQIWLRRKPLVTAKPHLSQTLRVMGGVFLDLVNFLVVLGFLAAVIEAAGNSGSRSMFVLSVYGLLVVLWTLLLWWR